MAFKEGIPCDCFVKVEAVEAVTGRDSCFFKALDPGAAAGITAFAMAWLALARTWGACAQASCCWEGSVRQGHAGPNCPHFHSVDGRV